MNTATGQDAKLIDKSEETFEFNLPVHRGVDFLFRNAQLAGCWKEEKQGLPIPREVDYGDTPNYHRVDLIWDRYGILIEVPTQEEARDIISFLKDRDAHGVPAAQ
jgi:hypothetical protein